MGETGAGLTAEEQVDMSIKSSYERMEYVIQSKVQINVKQ